MSDVVSKRYAQALFEVAQERDTIGAVEEQITLVKTVILEDDSFNRFFLNPQLALEERKRLINQLFGQVLNSEVENLLKILIDRHREGLITEIADEYVTIANDYRGIVDATVTSAFPLNDEEKTKITDQFGRLLNKKIRLNTKIDPSVIGGLVVKIGNRVYDGTVAGQLQRFKSNLKTVR